MITLDDTFALTRSQDPKFLEIASRSLKASVALYHPDEIYVVAIDNWFDAKWRGFSGKALGAIGVWKRPLTVPPFTQNRVRFEAHFAFDAVGGDYIARDIKATVAAPLPSAPSEF